MRAHVLHTLLQKAARARVPRTPRGFPANQQILLKKSTNHNTQFKKLINQNTPFKKLTDRNTLLSKS